jgi:hypothetical protein
VAARPCGFDSLLEHHLQLLRRTAAGINSPYVPDAAARHIANSPHGLLGRNPHRSFSHLCSNLDNSRHARTEQGVRDLGGANSNGTAGTQKKRTGFGGCRRRDPRRIRGSQAISRRDFYGDSERARSARNVRNEGCVRPEGDVVESHNLGRARRQSFLHGKTTCRAGTSGYRVSKTSAGILAD